MFLCYVCSCIYFCTYMFSCFPLQICLSLDCKLVLEIIRKLQTCMSSLIVHQISKTKTETIFNAITGTLYSVRRIRNLRLCQYNVALAFYTAYSCIFQPIVYSCIFHSCIFHPCNFDRIAFSTPAFSVAPSEHSFLSMFSKKNNNCNNTKYKIEI